jgi:glyceraldehyde-3-phosphate dehydrogenase (NADP+)
VNKAIDAAKTAQKSWAKTPLWKRAELLHKAAAILKEHKAPIAECLVKEIAKPAKDAVTEVCILPLYLSCAHLYLLIRLNFEKFKCLSNNAYSMH